MDGAGRMSTNTATAKQETFRTQLRQSARGPAGPTATRRPAGIAENLDLTGGLAHAPNLRLRERTSAFWNYTNSRSERSGRPIERQVMSPSNRQVMIRCGPSNDLQPVLMFGSNDYLGFANHPYIKERVRAAIDQWGVGAGGPPAINGYTGLLAEVESRVAALKGAEDCLIFTSGYGANVAIAGVLARERDWMLFDSLSHASFIDGLPHSPALARPFMHNDMNALERLLIERPRGAADTFIAVEGVYSMEGDTAPLDRVISLARKYDGFTIVDDAHGTGVLGAHGGGAAEHYGVHGAVDLTMGTFSKVFGVTGGFLAGSRELVRFLRFTARSYVFSAAPAPTVLAAISGGLDLMEREPELRTQLFDNTRYVVERLRRRGFELGGETPIIALPAPEDMDIDRACVRFQELGIFVPCIEFPAVPRNAQRFRVSITALHRRDDLDRLLAAIDDVWSTTRAV
jgi:8-amino-7-oxononanoate synthase